MNPLLHSFLGNAYLNEGRLDESIASSRAAVKLSPAMIHVHGLIGDALFLKEKNYKARPSRVQERAYRSRAVSRAVDDPLRDGE